MFNSIVPGAEFIQKNSSSSDVIEYAINQDKSMVARIMSYDETDGIAICESIWDRGSPKKQFRAHCRFTGKGGSPAAGNVDIGALVNMCRVGAGNGLGSDPALYDRDAGDKVSWVIFFLAGTTTEFTPIHALASAPGDVTKTDLPAGEAVISPRVIGNSTFQETNWRLLKGYSVFGNAASDLRTSEFFPGKVFVSSADVVPSPIRDTRLSCDGAVEAEKIYALQIVGGKHVVNGVKSDCFIFCSPGLIDPSGISCCDDSPPPPGEEIPPTDPSTLQQVTATVTYMANGANTGFVDQRKTKTFTLVKDGGAYNQFSPRFSNWSFGSAFDVDFAFVTLAWSSSEFRWIANFVGQGDGVAFSIRGQQDSGDPDVDAGNPFGFYSQPDVSAFSQSSTPNRFISFLVT